jgi:hypothetical protein
VTPEQIVAGATAEQTRAAWGVEDAYRDDKVPRLLVIRVGERWYARSAPDRRTQAKAWQDLWRQNVAHGIVSILDAKTGAPAVRFDPKGDVVGLRAGSPAEEEDRGGQPDPPPRFSPMPDRGVGQAPGPQSPPPPPR